MEAGHDRDGQVVEDRAEWGVGIVPGWSGAPLWGPGTFSRRQPGLCQGQTDGFKVRLCFLLRMRDVSRLNLSFFLYKMGESAGPQNCWESGV